MPRPGHTPSKGKGWDENPNLLGSKRSSSQEFAFSQLNLKILEAYSFRPCASHQPKPRPRPRKQKAEHYSKGSQLCGREGGDQGPPPYRGLLSVSWCDGRGAVRCGALGIAHVASPQLLPAADSVRLARETDGTRMGPGDLEKMGLGGESAQKTASLQLSIGTSTPPTVRSSGAQVY